jgi:multicomponent Na+:H+ antiporter subunit E
MIFLFINIMLAFLWSALTGQFTLENLTTGFILGYVVLFFLRKAFDGGLYFAKGAQIAQFTLFFLWELLIANLRVARDVLRPGPLKMRPRVIAIPLEHHGNVPLLLLANVVSLTPGTLLLDISDDRKTMFLHVIHAPDEEQVEQEIKQGFERQVLKLFSKQTSPAVDGKERKP